MSTQKNPYRNLALKRWGKEAMWVVGDGRFATLAWCPRGLTVALHETRGAAELAKKLIDQTACGGACLGPSKHEIVELGAI